MMRWIAAGASLTLIYCLTLASVHLWDVAIGAGLAAAVLATFRAYLFGFRAPDGTPGPPLSRRVIMFFPYMAMVVVDIIRGTLQVTLITLGLRPLVHPGIVAVPIEERTPLGVTVSALATTLSPGTFLVDIDWHQRIMLIHTIDASEPDKLRASMRHIYDRWQRHVFP
ncbi:MAG: cation transporter [Chloroflexota bacterium]